MDKFFKRNCRSIVEIAFVVGEENIVIGWGEAGECIYS